MDTKSYVKEWSDQPDLVEGGERVARMRVGDELVSVITKFGLIYVTVGNLFRSQTVRVLTYRDALKVCEQVSTGRPAKPPKGAELMENAK